LVAAGVALVSLVVLLVAPRLKSPTGTLLIVVSGRSATSLPHSALLLHSRGQWVALGDVSGAVPAAPAEHELLAASVPAGAYDGVQLGDNLQSVAITITPGQVEPLLLGIEFGHLIPGAAYAGNDEVNLGLGELGGKFIAMPPFELTDQADHHFRQPWTSGNALVIAAFHTTCHETCPLYTALFFQISKGMHAGVTLAEVTTDPATDTPAVLTEYAHRIGASWTFATGSPDALTAFWKPFGVELATGDLHTSTLALVDHHGYVRLVYRGVPDVGSSMPPQLITSLSAQGLKELASKGDGWGAPDVLQALLTIAGPQAPSPSAGGKLPAFTLSSTDGSHTSLDDLAGKPAVINFWATFCPPCRAEMPLLQKRAGPQSGVRLVLVNEGESAKSVRDYLSALGLHDPSLLDSDLTVGHAFGAIALPTTLFVRSDGTIANRHVGQLDDAVLAAEISNLASK
jgi:cytochrome oxidase Cu insertion factor (SCO1/SenC/PrrC family)